MGSHTGRGASRREIRSECFSSPSQTSYEMTAMEKKGEENRTLIRGSYTMSKSCARAAHGQQGGSDT